MSVETEIQAIERQVRELERLPALQGKVDASIDRADRILDHVNRSRAARQARAHDGAEVARRLGQAGFYVALVCVATIAIGLFAPIGIFGFLGAVGLAIGLAAIALFWPRKDIEMAEATEKVGNAELVRRFDRYMHQERKALPPPAKREVDAILSRLPELREVLERVPAGDPQAADARRLMSRHLPGLIDRYEQVPAGYRDSIDNEGLSVDERLVDGLKAGRKALDELGENLAKKDVRALETHGRFLKTKYGDKQSPVD
ncbi:hypothetical protein [Sphingomicrobium sediminis]|uniref:Uncharacterized protein n=1 Tax=Sphingomicrobium sediminis TaxID=2950949 RepID=A0A9X2EGW8_9SPHN|nr:hypothetical protein [Sphingomicrobium sediminis]MCM8557196.1 hypothetical protein [Sphingomicrobium sediminis]